VSEKWEHVVDGCDKDDVWATFRLRVPGGWLYTRPFSPQMTFVADSDMEAEHAAMKKAIEPIAMFMSIADIRTPDDGAVVTHYTGIHTLQLTFGHLRALANAYPEGKS